MSDQTLRGFDHHHTDEQLLAYAQVPIEQKIRWLEEMRELMSQAMTPEAKAFAQKLRRGEL
jgi:hypothetical protein